MSEMVSAAEHSWRVGFMRAVICGSIVVNAVTLAPDGHEETSQPAAGLPEVAYTIADYDSTLCPPIADNERRAVDDALAEPTNPAFTAANRRIGTYVHAKRLLRATAVPNEMPEETGEYKEVLYRLKEDMRQTVASEQGLTMARSLPYMRELHAFDMSDTYKRPFNDYLKAAQRYLGEFGVSVLVPTEPVLPPKDDMSPPGHETLETVRAKSSMISLIEAFGQLPKEYVSMVGLRHVWLVAGARSGSLAYAYLDENTDNNDIHLNLHHNITPTVIRHELMHLLHERLCGGGDAAGNMADFVKLNDGIEYYGEQAGNLKGTPEEYWQIRQALSRSLFDNQGLESGKEYEEAQSRLSAASETYANKVRFATGYAKKNELEDFAETGEGLGSEHSLTKHLESGFGFVDAKLRIVLALLWRNSPAIAKYFINSANHWEDSEKAEMNRK